MAWIFTGIAIFVDTLYLILYICFNIRLVDPAIIVMIVAIAITFVLSCYFYEKKLKHQFLQIHNFNKELFTMFDSLNDGIILFEPKG